MTYVARAQDTIQQNAQHYYHLALAYPHVRYMHDLAKAHPVKSVVSMIALCLFAKSTYDLVDWIRLDSISHIDCSSLMRHDLPIDRQTPEAQYCSAIELKSEFSTSNLAIIDPLKRAAEKGLRLARAELCRPSTYLGVNFQDFTSQFKAKLTQLCCPDGTLTLCPWSPSLIQQYQEHGIDYSTNGAKAFDF